MRSSSESASSSNTGSVGPAEQDGGHDGLLADGRVGHGRDGTDGRQVGGLGESEVPALGAEQRVQEVRPVPYVLSDAAQCDGREVGRVVVAVPLGDRGEPGRGVHEGGIDAVHGPVQGERGGGTAGALVRAGQPVPQLLALRLFAAAAHQRRREERLGLPVHLQPDPGHTAEQTGLDAEEGVVEQRVGVPDELFPVLDQIGAAGVQEADLVVGVDGRKTGERPVQLGHVPAVQPVRGVREQQIAGALQYGLDPPAQPVPGVERAAVPGALVAEAVAVPEHPEQRRRRVDAQRVQPEPAVGHAGIDPYRVAELLLRLRIRAHGVGVHAS